VCGVSGLKAVKSAAPRSTASIYSSFPPGSRLDHRCKALGTGNKLLELPILISLGMRETDVIGAWGPPSDRYRNTAQYYYQHPVRTLNKSSTLLNYVYIIYRDEKVWAIVADHSTQD